MTARRTARTGGSQAPPARPSPRRRGGQPWWQGPGLVAGALGLIVAAIIVFIVLGQRGGGPSNVPAGPELAAVTGQVTHIRPDVFDAAGTGGLPNPLQAVNSSQPLRGAGGKPEVLYIGAEFCPYCASERWSLIAALSRFGEFQNLEPTRSASNDVFPDTPTFTFVHSQYSSPYVDFASVETATRTQQPLQRMSAEQQALFTQYNPPGSIPFVDVGNRYVAVGSGFQPSVLSGKSWQEIAAALSDPSQPITRSIVGNANYLTAAICRATDGQPAAVCSGPAVAPINSQLGG